MAVVEAYSFYHAFEFKTNSQMVWLGRVGNSRLLGVRIAIRTPKSLDAPAGKY
jgi:hypothetical protein